MIRYNKRDYCIEIDSTSEHLKIGVTKLVKVKNGKQPYAETVLNYDEFEFQDISSLIENLDEYIDYQIEICMEKIEEYLKKEADGGLH